MTLKSILAAMLAVSVMACTAQGQRAPKPVLPEIADRPHWKVFRNHSSHNAAFFERLMFGRAFVYEHPTFPGVLQGFQILEDGKALQCISEKAGGPYWLLSFDLTFEMKSTGAVRTLRGRGKTYRSLVFFDVETGTLREERLASHEDPHKRWWREGGSGWVQDTWPRVLADACPAAALSAGVAINEKQTSRKLDELRRQDPDAPIRDFPGSQHTGPGRTGLAASGGKPTTTLEEIEAWMKSQEGNVLVSSRGNGYVFSEGWTPNTQIWKIGHDGHIAGFGRITRKTDASGQEWSISEVSGVGTLYYPIGYPLPLLSTGHRYPAWQLTDELIGRGEPVALPWMGERYEDHRFLFHDKTLTVVGPGEEYFTGRWRWTKGRLQVTVDGEEEHAQSIDWRDLARDLGVTPRMWTAATPNTR